MSESQWLCAECGARYDDHTPPCANCGGEEFAELHEPKTTQTTRFTYVCRNCGTENADDAVPCSDCGGLEFKEVKNTTETPVTEPEQSSAPPTGTDSDGGKDTEYYIGVLVGVAGVLLVPYFLLFVALPEAVFKWDNRSILDSLGDNVSENPFMQGTFLILGWFGNFLWLLVVLAVVGGVALLGFGAF